MKDQQAQLDNFKKQEEMLKMAERKIIELSDLIRKLESNSQLIYIAHKYDFIDLNLASFVNKYPEKNKMRIMFLRQSEGVYQFGSKRVYIKIEQGNQILVRVGGGYMGIKEFIEAYTQGEVEKIQRTNVIGRFQNKTFMQKVVMDQATRSIETTPICSALRSKSNLLRLQPMTRSLHGLFSNDLLKIEKNRLKKV